VGSPVSPVVANLHMEMFEELALSVMERTHVHTFLEHLNSLCPTRRFTMELESDGWPWFHLCLKYCLMLQCISGGLPNSINHVMHMPSDGSPTLHVDLRIYIHN